MHSIDSSKSADRESFILPQEDGMTVVDFEDPWVRREDVEYPRCDQRYHRFEGIYLNPVLYDVTVVVHHSTKNA